MIKELEGDGSFFQDDPVLKKYFFDRKPTKSEKEKIDKLYSIVNNFCKKVYNEEVSYLDIGYLDDFGYYELTYADRGWYDLTELGEDVNKVSLHAIDEILFSNGFDYELQNRKILEQEFDTRFKEFNFEPLGGLESNRRFNILHVTEYILSKWEKYYDGNIKEDTIKRYEDYINSIWWTKEQNITWEYDRDSKKINCKKVKDKEKVKR